MSKEIVIGTLFVLAVFMIMTSPAKEGWQPFAWFGYPGTAPGTVGYQARGDWCGIDPATRTSDKPLPLIAPRPCARGGRRPSIMLR